MPASPPPADGREDRVETRYHSAMTLRAIDRGQMRVGRMTPCGPSSASAVHDYLVLALHVGGTVVAEHHGEFRLQAGDLHLIPDGDAHRILSAHKAEVWGLGLCRSCLPRDRFGALLAPFDHARRGGSPVLHLDPARQERVLRRFAELEEELRSGAALGNFAAEGLLQLLLVEVSRALPAGPPPGQSTAGSLATAALEVIARRCLGKTSLDEVARELGRSPAHVTTTLRKETGRSVMSWVIEGRLDEAERRLRDTDEKIEAIAARVGYADSRHFTRLFQQRRGLTPAAWRAQARGSASGAE
jgi:AraC-like DNA-binding protein